MLAKMIQMPHRLATGAAAGVALRFCGSAAHRTATDLCRAARGASAFVLTVVMAIAVLGCCNAEVIKRIGLLVDSSLTKS